MKVRLRCPACDWTHWGNPTPVLAAVVENDAEQVLLARNALWQEGMFGLITGFLEAGESPEPDPAKWPPQYWAEDGRFMLPPAV